MSLPQPLPQPLSRLFTEHPAAVGESYFQHLRHAGGFAALMLAGGVACLVHAIFPFLCQRTGSAAITRLHQRMVMNRTRPAPEGSVDPALQRQ